MEDFDWTIYKKLNLDLQKAGLVTREQFEKHWLVFGKKEGRRCYIDLYEEYPNFNTGDYKALNPDLEFAGITTKKELEDHFIEYGRVENRPYFIPITNTIKSNNFLVYSKKTDVNPNNISIHLLLPTIGRYSIFTMLESISNQITQNDYITIVYDGLLNADNVLDLKQYICNWNCNINIYIEKNNLGYWGHAIRNLYKDLDGTFVFHIDDDDKLEENALTTIRSNCINKKYSYIFCFKINDKKYWEYPEIKKGNIGTPCGVVPIEINKLCSWGLKYGGDYDYYLGIKNNSKITFIQKITYIASNSNFRDINKIFYCGQNINNFTRNCIDQKININNILGLNVSGMDNIEKLQNINRCLNYSIQNNYTKILIVFTDVLLEDIDISKTNTTDNYIYIDNTNDITCILSKNMDKLIELLKT
jgi:hypothetical protein